MVTGVLGIVSQPIAEIRDAQRPHHIKITRHDYKSLFCFVQTISSPFLSTLSFFTQRSLRLSHFSIWLSHGLFSDCILFDLLALYKIHYLLVAPLTCFNRSNGEHCICLYVSPALHHHEMSLILVRSSPWPQS